MKDIQIDFWNVGQGDGTTITLPDGSLIVIDVGARRSSLSSWLSDSRLTHNISKLILTHNDNDHIGGLEAILNSKTTIERVYFLRDIHSASFHKNMINKLSKRANNVDRLECKTGQPFILESFDDYKLELRYPTMLDNLSASSNNATSGILVLSYKDNDCVSWGADTKLSIMDSHISSGVFIQFGPHHGAPQAYRQKKEKDALIKLNPSHCFISVGSDNKYKHPSSVFLKDLYKNDIIPICTELTKNFSTKLYKQGQDLYNSAALYCVPISTGIQCHGHVRFFIKNGILEFHQFTENGIKEINKLIAAKS